ncbi:ribbon-helix-helix domain-containing protein [Undibacter mobilis]|uniref:Aryl-sulfate sulfotransferase n=1 Tax=Undibacter mobilis TaxID=2292256 RepID=A0A371B0X0_9BRAD|nr:ribbon-helix-helix domain-containing protein [Undibacter mobilis]RDV01177.1 aryl-sulfate sulfotransferase [Undibacter mobilis]
MKSLVTKRSIIIGGHKTSVSLEDAFWQELKKIAEHRRETLSSLVNAIDTNRGEGNLSSAIRLFVLENARARAMEVMTERQASGATVELAQGR